MTNDEELKKTMEGRLKQLMRDPSEDAKDLIAAVTTVLNDSSFVASLANGTYEGFVENYALGDARNMFGLAFVTGMGYAFAAMLTAEERRKKAN